MHFEINIHYKPLTTGLLKYTQQHTTCLTENNWAPHHLRSRPWGILINPNNALVRQSVHF